MVTVPYLVFGVLGFRVYRGLKAAERQAQAQVPAAPNEV